MELLQKATEYDVCNRKVNLGCTNDICGSLNFVCK